LKDEGKLKSKDKINAQEEKIKTKRVTEDYKLASQNGKNIIFRGEGYALWTAI
jgi:hypothetical protein